MNPQQIIRSLRSGRDVGHLIHEDVGALTERLVTCTTTNGQRRVIQEYLTELYGQLGALVAQEHQIAINAQMEAATARSHQRSLLAVLTSVRDKWRAERMKVPGGGGAGYRDVTLSFEQKISRYLEEFAAPPLPASDTPDSS